MTIPPTETQLLRALAKMLPDVKIASSYETNKITGSSWFHYTLKWANGEIVKPTEYLALCRMVEERLTEEETGKYLLILNNGSQSSGLAQWNLTHASYSQRIQALSKVKGVEV